MRSPLSRSRRDTIRKRLLAWYAQGRRDLPWRKTRDPYRIWLSEAMLQQTRVETALPYYERFVERFPDLRALATADMEDVLREWAGLGYYARARNLKRAAELVVRDHGGSLPRSADALRALPGVGPYTVGAIRSIAFDQRAALVDGNVRRVLARLLAEPALADAETWSIARELVPVRAPGDFNQALMELGARVCTPLAPKCPVCPLRRVCRAAAAGEPERYPAAQPRAKPRRVALVSGIVSNGTRLLMLRRPEHGLLGGLWEVPTTEGRSADTLARQLRERTGIETRPGAGLGRVQHLLSHRSLDVRVVELERTGGRLRGRGTGRWCGRAALAALPLSTLMRKVLSLRSDGPAAPVAPTRPSA